jgi:ankyrin repeat protein
MRIVAQLETALAVLILTLVLLSSQGSSLLSHVVRGPTPGVRLMLAAGGETKGEFDDALADGASINARDCLGQTPLMWAAGTGPLDLTRRLIGLGANVNAEDRFGNTALMLAAQNDRIEIVRLLLRHGADPAHRNHHGDSALDYAKIWHADHVVKLLGSQTPATKPR